MTVIRKTDMQATGMAGDSAPFTVDGEGRLRISQPRDIAVTSGATAQGGSLDLTTEVDGPFVLLGVAFAASQVPTSAENLVVALDAAGGAAYDVPLYAVDPSTDGGGKSEIFWQPAVTIYCEDGDQINVAFANTDENDCTARIVTEGI